MGLEIEVDVFVQSDTWVKEKGFECGVEG